MKKIFYFCFIAVIIFLSSCGNQNNTQIIDEVDTINDLTEKIIDEQIFQVPSPDEFIYLLKHSKANYKSNIVSPLNDYILPLKQKLNLGVYAADMSYLATFGKFQETIRYFSKIKSMSDQLGLTNAIEKSAIERIEKNLNNLDSLTNITNNYFYNIMERLRQNSDEKTVAAIYIGGWVESMYIAFQLLDKYEQNHPIVQRIAAQKLTLNNLLQMCKSINNIESDFNSWIETLKSIYEIMQTIEVKTEEINTSDTTKVFVGTKNTYLISNDTFQNIKTKIENLRTEIIKQ